MSVFLNRKFLIWALCGGSLIGGLLSFPRQSESLTTKAQAFQVLKDIEQRDPVGTAKSREEARDFNQIVELLKKYESAHQNSKRSFQKELLRKIEKLSNELAKDKLKKIATGNLSEKEKMSVWVEIGRSYTSWSYARDPLILSYEQALQIGEQILTPGEFLESPMMKEAQFNKAMHYSDFADPRLAKREIEKYIAMGGLADADKKPPEGSVDRLLYEKFEVIKGLVPTIEKVKLMTPKERETWAKDLDRKIAEKAGSFQPRYDIYLGFDLFEKPVKGGLQVDIIDKDSPAEKAGLRTRDIIIGIGKWKIKGEPDFREAYFQLKPGEMYPITIIRDDKELTLKLYPAPWPANRQTSWQSLLDSYLPESESYEIQPGTHFIPYTENSKSPK